MQDELVEENDLSMEDDLADESSRHLFVLLIASIAAMAGILFGYDTGVISGAILYINKQFSLTVWESSVVVSSVLVGALMGCIISGRVADYLGRRMLLIIVSIIFLVGTLGSAFANSLPSLVLFRLVVGFAIGIASYTAPLYISEISPSKYRGALVSLNQLALTIGIVISYMVDAYYAKQGGYWRWMLITGVIPACVLLVGMIFLPKSPRWLVYRGLKEQGRQALQKIRGIVNVDLELKEIQDSMTTRTSWRMLLQKWLRPVWVVGFGLAFFQQCTGINTIIYYSPTIFEIAGFHSYVVAILATLVIGMANVLFTIIALPLIDKWGRRPLLLLGLFGMTVGLIGLSVVFYWGAQTETLKHLAMGAMILYIASFAISLGPILWLMISEIYPLEVRGLGASLAASACWGFNFIVTLSFLSLIQWFGPSGTFLLYAIMCIVGFIFVAVLVPETKGVHLEVIEMNLRAGIKSRFLGQKINY